LVLGRTLLTPAVLAIAQAAYDNRILPARTLEPTRLAVLADALEDAGCTDAGLLGHLGTPWSAGGSGRRGGAPALTPRRLGTPWSACGGGPGARRGSVRGRWCLRRARACAGRRASGRTSTPRSCRDRTLGATGPRLWRSR